MQLVSKEFEQAMKLPFRNRAYIRVSIGVINSDAQNNAEVDLQKTELTYFANEIYPFNGYSVDKMYVTCEQDLSKVDGSMYFLPKKNSLYELYNAGIVTNEILGSVRIDFRGVVGLDIKGLTIDFGECYPNIFTIETDTGIKSYENNKALFTTEDSFDGTSYILITPSSMVNGQGRLRIHKMSFGIANMFGNEKVISCSANEFVSPISESIPSMDISLKIDNRDLYYSVDNPKSSFAYMEEGQEVKVAFGYDVTGNGDIEWLPDTTTYLDTWSADDAEANFTSTDRFYQLSGTYYRGLYRKSGISLYDLAIDVLKDAGITDVREFYIDNYLKKVIVYNPLPPVSHAEALQIIANAGRCVLREDRSNKIFISSSFVPDMIAELEDKTPFSKMDNILKDTKKAAYAMASNDFSSVNGNIFFLPKDEKYLETGYVSESVADSEGIFKKNPKIVINAETAFTAFGILVDFRNTAPSNFKITTYKENVKIEEFLFENTNLEFNTDTQFLDFDKMELEITKGYPNARVVIDKIIIGDRTNYELNRKTDLLKNPTGIRQKKIKNINVIRTIYRESQDGFHELASETVLFSGTTEYIVYFTYPSYGFQVKTPDNPNIKVEILDSSNYFLKLRFSNIEKQTDVKFVVNGYEYVSDENNYTANHNPHGQEVSWNNPLISTIEQAKDLEEWLASHYLGDVDYEIEWRGDPRVEANDLFYLDLKERESSLIRSYKNELEFNGSWSGRMKARKVGAPWQKI